MELDGAPAGPVGWRHERLHPGPVLGDWRCARSCECARDGAERGPELRPEAHEVLQVRVETQDAADRDAERASVRRRAAADVERQRKVEPSLDAAEQIVGPLAPREGGGLEARLEA